MRTPSTHWWSWEGHRFREESVWDKGDMLEEKVFADDKLLDEFEYFPDGSLKSHQVVAPSPVTKT